MTTNGFAVAQRWVDEIERHHETLASYQGEYMARCRSVRELITGCYDAAKDAGIPRAELRAVIKERQLLAKIEAMREDMEPEQRETLDQIKHALGMLSDLPLGETALKRSDAIDSLTAQDDPDPEAIAAETNTAALRAGIRAVQ